MIPYAIDPTLHAAEPEQLLLDDGFSPPRGHLEAPAQPAPSLDHALSSKSDF